MGMVKSWFWRNVLWRFADERCKHDEYFRRSCRVVFIDKPALGGKAIDRFQIQSLSMAPAGATVVVKMQRDEIVMQVTHPKLIKKGYTNEFYIRADPDSQELYLYIELAMFADGPKGLGAVGFFRCAQVGCALGLARVDLLAAGGKSYKIAGEWNPGFNGYYSWARFGFNAPLHPLTAEAIAALPRLAGAKDLLEIIERDPHWWSLEGGGGEMTFDLRAGSRSWHTLPTYLSDNGYRQ
ncbi:hypothetical protein [Roseateles terrae]|uniref:DUF4365 domain-containing protein n=1 Tax=Roseateles terrae TaxID=431060 RepID=A0ABR6GPR1_9BURK|nr:hypothetical protein [Roseateles terrae]MBB3193229.1 hypothetical protein [Roseateles terrae]OWQ89558.1 hypothetical protein CDN98_03260 [Roseateles terrae]